MDGGRNIADYHYRKMVKYSYIINIFVVTFQAYQESFIHTIKLILGSDRFTENTENSFNLLYGYIREELCKYLDDEQEPEPVTVDNTQVEVNLCHEGDT